jgi:LytS/YehU family sensor histidine kinase
MKFKKLKSFLYGYAYWAFAIIGGISLIFWEDEDIEPVFSIMAFIYFSLLIFWGLRWIFRQIRGIIKLKKEKTQMELTHLQSQVNPHFFFNTLNNLYGLVDKDSKKAQELILKLSDMMRYSIYDGQKETVLLSEEISYLQNYLELHKMRYHKKIDVQFNIDVKYDDYKVMPLLYIILLENAFKHGVENLRENAYVYINLIAENNEIYFDIENNFDETLENEQGGIGLNNLKRRLELVYPKNHTLTFSKTNGVYKAQLKITKL